MKDKGSDDMSNSEKLTPKQSLFVENYALTMNATESYKMSGYSASNNNIASVEGWKLLRNPKLKIPIDLAIAKRQEENKLTVDYVLTSLRMVADRCTQKECVLGKDGLPSGEWKFDSSGANKSLELLGKYLKLFTEKTETTTEVITSSKIDLSTFTVDELKEMLVPLNEDEKE